MRFFLKLLLSMSLSMAVATSGAMASKEDKDKGEISSPLQDALDALDFLLSPGGKTLYVKMPALLIPYYRRGRRVYAQLEYSIEINKGTETEFVASRRRLRSAFLNDLHVRAELSDRKAKFNLGSVKILLMRSAKRIMGKEVVVSILVRGIIDGPGR